MVAIDFHQNRLAHRKFREDVMELKELPNIPGSQSTLQESPLPIEFCEILRRVCQDSSIWQNEFKIAKPYLLVGVVSVPSRHLRRRADAFGEKRRDLLQRVQINWPAKLAWAVSLKIYDSSGEEGHFFGRPIDPFRYQLPTRKPSNSA